MGVAGIALPSVIAYALVRSNNDGSEGDVADTTPTTIVTPTATVTPEPIQQVTPEPTPEALGATAQPSLSPPIEEASPAPQEERPLPTSTVPAPTPTILPVVSSIFAGPGVLFEPDDAEIDGLTVKVKGTVSSRDFKIARIVWDWGDGTVEEGWFPARHTYGDAGRYVWSVTVYDDGGIEIAGQSSSIDVGR